MKTFHLPYYGITAGDIVEYSPVGNMRYSYCRAKGRVLNIEILDTNSYAIKIRQLSKLNDNPDKSFYKIGSVTTGCYGDYFEPMYNLKLLSKEKQMKRFTFYFLKKPQFHIYQDNDLFEVSFAWLNFIFVKRVKWKINQ